MWKAEGALQFATNLSLPGGFLLASTGNQYCDVTTSTGEYSCLQVPTLELPTNLHEVSQCSEKAPIKAFSLLKAHTSALTLKNLFSFSYSSIVQVDLLFARELSFYIITIYLPTMMIVIVSWFSFWIDHKSVMLHNHSVTGCRLPPLSPRPRPV